MFELGQLLLDQGYHVTTRPSAPLPVYLLGSTYFKRTIVEEILEIRRYFIRIAHFSLQLDLRLEFGGKLLVNCVVFLAIINAMWKMIYLRPPYPMLPATSKTLRSLVLKLLSMLSGGGMLGVRAVEFVSTIVQTIEKPPLEESA